MDNTFLRISLNVTAYWLPVLISNKHLFAKWQHFWHYLTSNKLHNIYFSLPIIIKHYDTQFK